MCHYNHFTTEEREKSRVMREQGLSIRAIARILKRSPSTVSREFSRNSYANGSYAAHHADNLCIDRKNNIKTICTNSKTVVSSGYPVR